MKYIIPLFFMLLPASAVTAQGNDEYLEVYLNGSRDESPAASSLFIDPNFIFSDVAYTSSRNYTTYQSGLVFSFIKADGSRELLEWNISPDFIKNPPPSSILEVHTIEGGFLYILQDGSIWHEGAPYGPLASGIPTGNDFVKLCISRSFRQAYAITSNGEIKAWGEHTHYTKNGGNNGFCLIEQFPDYPIYKDVALDKRFAVALLLDGSLLAWGHSNNYGQLDTPPGNDFTQVMTNSPGNAYQLRYQSASALHQNGSISSWGCDLYGAVSDTPMGSGFIQLETNRALHSDGTFHWWGLDPHPNVSYNSFLFKQYPSSNLTTRIYPETSMASRKRGPYSNVQVVYSDHPGLKYEVRTRVTDCTPNSDVVIAWSGKGGGPSNTAYGLAYISPPFNQFSIATNALGGGYLKSNIQTPAYGVDVWVHGVDLGSQTMFINHHKIEAP